jgi:hypothetical protein
MVPTCRPRLPTYQADDLLRRQSCAGLLLRQRAVDELSDALQHGPTLGTAQLRRVLLRHHGQPGGGVRPLQGPCHKHLGT